MPRRRLLLVTPVMPAPTGGGLAMRAASTLKALSRHFAVELLVVPVAGVATTPSDFVLRHATRVQCLNLENHLDPHFALIARLKDPAHREHALRAYPKPHLSRFCTGEGARYLYEWSDRQAVAAVHVMRLYLAPFADLFLRLPESERPACVLDLDDDEILTRRRLADLHRAQSDCESAEREESELQKYAAFATRYLPAFDRVTVCSTADADRLALQHPHTRFAVVPNGYDMPDVNRRTPLASGPLRLLFVGTLDYFPNSDAVRFLCSDVCGALRRLSDREIEIDIVGSGGIGLARSLQDSGARIHGYMPSVAPFHAAADVAIVPIRAGGGTRIKILEAFAHRVPVVSTTIGAEGIDAIDGEHLLIGDDAESLARACLRVKSSPALAHSLAERAATLCSAAHGAAAIEKAIGDIYRR